MYTLLTFSFFPFQMSKSMIASVKAKEIEIEQKDALQVDKWKREDEVHTVRTCVSQSGSQSDFFYL